MIVAGLYSVLWGKYKEEKEKEKLKEIPQAIKAAQVNNNIINNNNIELHKAEAKNIPTVGITLPTKTNLQQGA